MAFIRKISLGGNHGLSATTYVGDIDDIWTDDVTKNILRRGDGTTPGGVIIGGAAGTTDYNNLTNKPDLSGIATNTTDIVANAAAIAANTAVHSVEKTSADTDRALIRTEFAAADATLANTHATELANNTATLQGNITTNTAAIAAETTRASAAEAVLTAAIPTTRTTLTMDQSAVSSDITNKTQIDADVYSAVFIYNTPSPARYLKLLDGSYDGQIIRINRYGNGGSAIQIEMKLGQADGTSSISNANTGTPFAGTVIGTYMWNGTMWWRV